MSSEQRDEGAAGDEALPSAAAGAASRKRKLQSQPPPPYVAADAFRYGNYARYYGKRIAPANNNEAPAVCAALPEPFYDARLRALVAADLLANKRVLDIGCNDGSLTLALAALCDRPAEATKVAPVQSANAAGGGGPPRKVLAIDIDASLVARARRKRDRWMALADGPTRSRLERVRFDCANYVLADEAALERVRAEYDTVLALSVTKWVQLNWADAGLRAFFGRAARSLVPGGRLLVEPQPWQSYAKARKANRRCWNDELEANYRSIRLKPEQFAGYLISLGLEQCASLVPDAADVKAGFDRHILVFRKPL